MEFAAIATAAAAPVFLLVVAVGWQASAEDDLASSIAETVDLRANGVDLAVDSSFSAAAVEHADDLVLDRFDEIDRLNPSKRVLYTLPGRVSSPVRDQTIATPARLMAQEGAFDQVRVIEQSTDAADGIWISDWFAEQFDLQVGDPLTFGSGSAGGFGEVESPVITAVYERLWDENNTPPAEFWRAVAPELIPRYISPIGGPSNTLILVAPEVMASSGVTGVARWRADLASSPQSLDEFRSLQDEYRRFETALVADGPLATAMVNLANAGGAQPQFVTGYYETTTRVERAVGRLGDPMRSGLTLGLVLSLPVLVAAAFFVVEGRRSEFRLLASGGDRWFRIAARFAAQSIAPATIGVGASVLLGAAFVRWYGPNGVFSFAEVDWWAVLAILVLAVAGTSVVAGLVGQSLVGSAADGNQLPKSAGVVAFIAAGAAAVLLWVQAGEVGANVDTASLALPVIAFLLATSLSIGGLRMVVRHAPSPSARRRPGVLLAWRRVAQGARPLSIAVIAIGLGFGLVLTSVSLVATLDRSLDAKLATQIGGATRWTVAGELPEERTLPAGSTWLHNQDTEVSPGRQRVRVVAVEEATFVSALSWHEEFGIDIDEAARLLRSDVGEALPVLAISGEGVPTRGGFGASQTYPYEVVARVNSLPMAGQFGSTIMVSSDRLDEWARIRFEGALEEAVFRAPTSRFRHQIISVLSDQELEDELGSLASELNVRERFSTSSQRSDPNLLATRFGYEYLRMVGGVAVVVALAALVLYLSARRRTAVLSSVMSRSIGVRASQIVGSTMLEIGVVVSTAIAGASVVALPVIRRLAARFDPAPDIPPSVGAVLGWSPIFGAGSALVVVAVVLAAIMEWRDLRRPVHEVLRRVS